MAPVGVLGATSWGVTIARLLTDAGNSVRLICRSGVEADRVRALRGIERLPEVRLGESVGISDGPGDEPCAGLVVAVPAQTVGENLAPARFRRDAPVLCAAKGIELRSGRLLPEVITALGWPPEDVSILSGPNLAHEIARGLPAASVVASPTIAAARVWQSALMSPRFRVYVSGDTTGVALGGALKNVVAIAAGAATGAGYGTNALASLVTRGLAEITRLGVALGADPITFQGLAGVGDLMATCFSPLSRNHRLGVMLAGGMTPMEALQEIGETVEGVATARAVEELAAGSGVEMPIAATVAAALTGRLTVLEAAARLLERPPAAEASSAD